MVVREGFHYDNENKNYEERKDSRCTIVLVKSKDLATASSLGAKEGSKFSFETKVLDLTIVMLSTKRANRERIVALRGNRMGMI